MFTVPSQVAEFQKVSVDNLVKIANIQLESAKSLLDLHIAATREFVEEGVKSAQSLAAVKDPKDFVSLQSAVKPVAGKALSLSRSVYDIIVKANADIKAVADAHVAEVNKYVASAIETATKNAPAGSEPAVAFVKSTLSSATTAFDQAAKVGKQIVETAEANVAAAFSAIEKPLAA